MRFAAERPDGSESILIKPVIKSTVVFYQGIAIIKTPDC